MRQYLEEVSKNPEAYWHDSTVAIQKPGKYVRSAYGTKLGLLLTLIDKEILSVHDRLVPQYAFGVAGGRGHVRAMGSLRGKKQKRVHQKLDIEKFFERISRKRVYHFFRDKAGCSSNIAELLSLLVCVHAGPKSAPEANYVLARGFATSPRLALWSNLTTFNRINWKANRMLKGHDPRFILYVDDIGITASGISISRMEEVRNKIENLLENFDDNQSLPTNKSAEKRKTSDWRGGIEQLGIRMGRRRLSPGTKVASRIRDLQARIRKGDGAAKSARRNYRGYEASLRVRSR
jgi:hypothetical protein